MNMDTAQLRFALCALASLSSAEAETYCVYHAPGADMSPAETVLAEALPQNAAIDYHALPTACTSMAEAEVQARALSAGVKEIPCLVISDNAGPYAVLPLEGLTPESVQQIQVQATAEDRAENASKRELSAAIYLLCAALQHDTQDNDSLERIISTCRQLLEHPKANLQQKQFIGLRCLYPALMLQYKRGYNGAHTPYTEAKLLEAIAALEAARDLHRETKLGNQALKERERLRKARREARKYE